jgi:PAS domain-containing protein
MTVARLGWAAGVAALVVGLLTLVPFASLLGSAAAIAVFASAIASAVCVILLGPRLLRPLRLMAKALAPDSSNGGRTRVDFSRHQIREVAVLAGALNETERRLQAMLLQSQRDRAQMATIFEHMADGVLVLDADDRIELSNPGATRLLRQTRLAGMSLAEAVRDADLVEVVRAVRTGGPVTQLVELRSGPDRARSWLRARRFNHHACSSGRRAPFAINGRDNLPDGVVFCSRTS